MNPSYLERLIGEIRGHRLQLGFSFVLVFIFTLVALNTVGLAPEPMEATTSESIVPRVSASETPVRAATLAGDVNPIRVVIDSVGIDAHVATPVSRDIAMLDSALLRGAVHYPGSGTLAETSNMFIFGHSSHLPVVNNTNFRAFNNLEKVEEGDIVRVESSDLVSFYRVVSVELESADEALIELSNRSKTLTLSTCNSFGEPSDRFVVKADFIHTVELTRPTAYLDKS